jgi:hypothetical protein
MRSRWLLGIASAAVLVLVAVLRMDALAVAAFAGLALAILLPNQVLQDMFARLRRAEPLEFDPVKEPSVKKALDAVDDDVRAKAEENAREVSNRLGRQMDTVARFANAVRAELAALGVRVTAIEEVLVSVRDRVHKLEAAARSEDRNRSGEK